jgi:hypothetical protein
MKGGISIKFGFQSGADQLFEAYCSFKDFSISSKYKKSLGSFFFKTMGKDAEFQTPIRG